MPKILITELTGVSAEIKCGICGEYVFCVFFFYLDMHLRSWSLVQEVVSGGILNNIVNIGSSHEKNLQASLLCFWMETMVISMCVHILSPPKNWSQRRSFMKIGSTIKGRHHLSDWVVGEDYL